MGTVIEYFASKRHISEFLKLDYSPKYKMKLSKQKDIHRLANMQ